MALGVHRTGGWGGEDRPADAARHFDEAAAAFGDHLGSWVAAGWACLLAEKDMEARRRFETALGLDDTFGETHAGLALLDLRAGNAESAREQAQRAMRLDPASPGAALARVVIARLDSSDSATAEVLHRVLQGDLGGQGPEIQRVLARRGPAAV